MGLSNSGWRNPSFAPNTQAQQYQVPFAAPQLHSPQPQSAGFGSHAMRQGNTSAMNHTQPFAHASGFARGHNIPNLHINTSEIIPAQVHSDPFVDNSSTTAVNAWRQNTQNAVSPSGPFTSPRNNGGLSQEYRTHAKALANYIKSGALEQQDTSPPRSQTASQALLVARTPAPALRLERVPNPPFLKRALKQGILPSFDDAIKHVPFVEPGRRVQPSTLGCVVIRNVRLLPPPYLPSLLTTPNSDPLQHCQSRNCRRTRPQRPPLRPTSRQPLLRHPHNNGAQHGQNNGLLRRSR